MTESWTNWEGEVINRSFALRRYLGGSEHSGVFLTDHPEHELKAAIKLVPVEPAMAEARVANWRSVATLSHPHLMRVFDAGQVTRAGQNYVFVVMEYADETLAELLPQRALSADEARAMLPAVLDALAFLHGRNLVLGQVKPSNIVVVQDQVKLAADTVQPPGRLAGVTASAVYAAPEARGGQFSRASDVWSLGITIIEALTRHPPSSADGRPGVASLSAELPRDFVSLVVRCLNPNPSVRPSPQQLKAWITGDANGTGTAGALSPEAFGGTGQAATREPAAAAPERVMPATPPAPERGYEPAAAPRHQSPPQGRWHAAAPAPCLGTPSDPMSQPRSCWPWCGQARVCFMDNTRLPGPPVAPLQPNHRPPRRYRARRRQRPRRCRLRRQQSRRLHPPARTSQACCTR